MIKLIIQDHRIVVDMYAFANTYVFESSGCQVLRL